MRSEPAEYELIAPDKLSAVLSLLAQQPGEWLPIAGGTDVMVLYGAGRLPARRLVSLWNLPELRRIDIRNDEITIGAGSTYTDLRENAVIVEEFPLLASAASLTGAIANQNRGTLGGNIVNASPAADSLPALLVYEAELILVSVRGERPVPYVDFHTGYKKTLLATDELIQSIRLTRRFRKHFAYSRKVGARNAQAIAKVCIAALGKCSNQVIEDVRIAGGSVAPTPLRLRQTEQLLRGKKITADIMSEARRLAMEEISPIDDVRSTRAYRSAVLGNLVEEFLSRLRGDTTAQNKVLVRWNRLPEEEAVQEILACCGSRSWARGVVSRRPFEDERSLLQSSDELWNGLAVQDWMEAFSKHPKIGERKAPAEAGGQSAAWSEQEQASATTPHRAIQQALAEGNREYEQRFGRVFIVCATGKSAAEILEILGRRLANDDATELRQSAEEQRKITNIRLKKWLTA
jgi:OHCU decarboxylase